MITQGDVSEWEEQSLQTDSKIWGEFTIWGTGLNVSLYFLWYNNPMRWVLLLCYFIEKFNVSQVHIAYNARLESQSKPVGH